MFKSDWICPHCKMANSIPIDKLAYVTRRLVTCDTDEGGCGTEYAIDIKIHVDFDLYKLNLIQN